MAAPVSARIGTSLAGYRIEALLGRGGMGVVYRAHDLALDRDVALKLLAPHLADDVAFRERFLTESRVAASLEHPNVVPIHDAGEIDGQLYIVMRLVVGSDLKVTLRGGPLSPERTVRITEQIASALDAAHARGLVHRDVKPSNVLLDEHGHVYLADFGLSRYLGDAASSLGPGRSLGTADYVAPEQIRCEEVDGRADVYALGCLLYESLDGEPPFRRGSEAATLFAQLEDDPPTLPGLEGVLTKALAKDPANRYTTCSELIADAREALGITEPKRSLWPIAVAAVGIALIAAALGGYFLTRGDSAAQPTTTGRLVRIDATTGEVKQTIRVGNGPTSVTTGSGAVWIASSSADTIWRVDPRSGAVRSVTGLKEPLATAVAAGRVYVVTRDAIGRIDADTGALDKTMAEELSCSSVAIGAGKAGLWIADAGGCASPTQGASRNQYLNVARRLSVLADPLPGSAADRIWIPRQRNQAHDMQYYSDLAVGSDAVWVVGDSFEQVVWRLDPRTRTAARTALPGAPLEVAIGAGGIWVTALLDDRVWRVDPVTRRVIAAIPVGSGSAGVAVAGGSVWVTNAIDGTVTRIDPRTNEVRGTIDVGGYVPAIAADGSDVWVAADDS